MTEPLPTLDNPTAVWDRPADTVRDGLNRQIERIRGHSELSTDALLSLVSAAYLKGKAQLDGMNTNNPAQVAAQVAAVKRAAFGIDDLLTGASQADKATMAMSFRDAQQRAAQTTTSSEAQTLLDVANQSGDELLARAVGNHALSSMDMGDVAEAYLTNHPTQAEALDELQQLQKPANAATMFEFVAPKPPEISGMPDGQIAAYAAQASKYGAV